MLMDAQGQRLVTGAGRVDSPATQASSTSSELHGFAANVRSLEPNPFLNSNNGGDNHTIPISFLLLRNGFARIGP